MRWLRLPRTCLASIFNQCSRWRQLSLNAMQEIERRQTLLLPSYLWQLLPFFIKFTELLSEHEERLRRTFSGSVVDQGLNSEFEKLVRLISRDSDMQSALAKASESKQGDFRLSWRPLGTRFPNLLRFAAGLATVMPGTATVEADFSIINYEKRFVPLCSDQLLSRGDLALKAT